MPSSMHFAVCLDYNVRNCNALSVLFLKSDKYRMAWPAFRDSAIKDFRHIYGVDFIIEKYNDPQV